MQKSYFIRFISTALASAAMFSQALPVCGDHSVSAEEKHNAISFNTEVKEINERKIVYNDSYKEEKFEKVICGENVVEMDDLAFSNCKNLKVVDLSKCKNLKALGRRAFSGCSKLEKILLPEGFAVKYHSKYCLRAAVEFPGHGINESDCRKFYGINNICKLLLSKDEKTSEQLDETDGLATVARIIEEIPDLDEKSKNMASDLMSLYKKYIDLQDSYANLQKEYIKSDLNSKHLQEKLDNLQNNHNILQENHANLQKDHTDLQKDTVSMYEAEGQLLASIDGTDQKTYDIYKDKYDPFAADAKGRRQERIKRMIEASRERNSLSPFYNKFGNQILDQGRCGNSAFWTLTKNGTLTVFGSGEMDNYSQDKLDQRPWHKYISNIRKVSIEGDLASIGKFAFCGCDNLLNISILNCGRNFFKEIDNATNFVDMGQCGVDAFWTFTKDGTLTVFGSGNMQDYPWKDKTWTECVGRSYEEYRTKIKKAVIDDGITSTGYLSFLDCMNLKYVSIAESVIRIQAGAFLRCHSLPCICLPKNCIFIHAYSFRSCTSLSEAHFYGDLKSINDYAFGDCPLTKIICPPSVKTKILNKEYTYIFPSHISIVTP